MFETLFAQQVALICADKFEKYTKPLNYYTQQTELDPIAFGKPFVRVVSMLLRTSLEQMLSYKLDTKVEFAYALSTFQMILRVALHFVTSPNYNALVIEIKKSLYAWSLNPFSPTTRKEFDNWFDPILLGMVVHYDTNSFRSATAMRILVQMMINHDPTDKMADIKDDATWLRQLYSEGRNAKIVKTYLFAQSLIKIIAPGTPNETAKNLDTRLCFPSIPTVEKLMCELELTKKIDGFQQNNDIPGFWSLLMLRGCIDQRADRTLIIATLKELRKNVSSLYETNLSKEQIAKLDIKFQAPVVAVRMSATDRQHAAELERDMQYAELKAKHIGFPLAKKGRPTIGSAQCLYEKCMQKFSSGQALMSHLHAAGVDCDNGYHLKHQYWINRNKDFDLTQVSICPACNDNYADCVTHFVELGIEPVWTEEKWQNMYDIGQAKLEAQKEEALKAKTNEKEAEVDKAKVPDSIPVVKIALPGHCAVCMDAKIDTTIIPCGHACACLDCLDNLNECPVCREPKNFTIPLELAKADEESGNLKVYLASEE